MKREREEGREGERESTCQRDICRLLKSHYHYTHS